MMSYYYDNYSKKRQRRTDWLTKKDVYRPLLEVLIASGGSANTADIYCLIHNKIGHTFVADDWKPIGDENYRWQNVIRWCYQDLKNDGLLSFSRYRKVWVITERGRLYVERDWI